MTVNLSTLYARVYKGDSLVIVTVTGKELIIKWSQDETHVQLIEKADLGDSILTDL